MFWLDDLVYFVQVEEWGLGGVLGGCVFGGEVVVYEGVGVVCVMLHFLLCNLTAILLSTCML